MYFGKTDITGYHIKAFVQGLSGQLKYLELKKCPSVSPDAIDWARDQGVETIVVAENGKSGRKARYG